MVGWIFCHKYHKGTCGGRQGCCKNKICNWWAIVNKKFWINEIYGIELNQLKSANGVLGNWTQGCKMVGADKTTELWFTCELSNVRQVFPKSKTTWDRLCTSFRLTWPELDLELLTLEGSNCLLGRSSRCGIWTCVNQANLKINFDHSFCNYVVDTIHFQKESIYRKYKLADR